MRNRGAEIQASRKTRCFELSSPIPLISTTSFSMLFRFWRPGGPLTTTMSAPFTCTTAILVFSRSSGSQSETKL